jgi:hypothetical protein
VSAAASRAAVALHRGERVPAVRAQAVVIAGYHLTAVGPALVAAIAEFLARVSPV